MAQQGWYPDPGGQPGMFRYWDGQQWSQALSPTPLPGPPPTVWSPQSPGGLSSGSGIDPTQPITPGHSFSGAGTSNAFDGIPTLTDYKAKTSVAPWIISIVGVLVLALVVFFVVRMVTGEEVVILPPNGETNSPTPNKGTTSPPPTRVCPKESMEDIQFEHPVGDGWVYGGALAYRQLPSPWDEVVTDNRIPFGRDVSGQEAVVHMNPNPVGWWPWWVAGVWIGELYAGDGFYDPQEGSEIVNRCIFGSFYGNESPITSETLRSEAYTLDGHDGWITETMLSFDIKDLETTSELSIVIIVRTSDLTSSIYFASWPTDAPTLRGDIDATIASLRVVK